MDNEQRVNVTGSTNVLVKTLENEQRKLEAERLQAEKEEKKINFAKKQDKLLNKIIEFENKFGEDYYLVTMLKKFYEVSVEMETVMETMDAINDAMDCITESISFLDSALEFDQNLITGINSGDNGVFARWKAKRQMKKARRNTVGRMKSVISGFKFKYALMEDMVESMNGFAKSMSTGKGIIKNNKKGPSQTGSNSEAQRRIAERRASMGSSSSTGQAGTVSGASGGTDNYDDI